jgi:hypothetical protein
MNKSLESRGPQDRLGQKLCRNYMDLAVAVTIVTDLTVYSRQVEDVFDVTRGLLDNRFVENVAANPFDVQVFQFSNIRRGSRNRPDLDPLLAELPDEDGPGKTSRTRDENRATPADPAEHGSCSKQSLGIHEHTVSLQ